MSLIIENGTGVPLAQSYISVADADQYHADFGNTAWTDLSLEEKEIALRRATVYIDTSYEFSGRKKFYNQRLMWPRYGYAEYEVYPEPNLVQACCELALRAGSGELVSDGEDQVILREVIGPIRTDYAYKGTEVRYTAVDRLLKPFTSSSGSSIRIEFTG